MKQSSKLFKFVGLLLVVGLIFAALPTGQVKAATITVTSGQSIQAAITGATAGDVINVGAGTYIEQLDIVKNITLVGAGVGLSIIQAPASLPDSSLPTSAIVQVHGTGVVAEISGFTITGPGPSACGSIRAGLYIFDSADAKIHDNRIADIRDVIEPPAVYPSGCQNGVAILVGRQAWATTGTATITNNVILGYQKGGIVVDNTGSNAFITGNTITGAGTIDTTAQNGIQISRGATATLTGNTVTGNSFHNDLNESNWGAAGVLLWQANTVVFNGANNISMNDNNVYVEAGSPVDLGDTTIGASTMPPVVNVTQNKYYTTIQAALDAATTVAGDKITVAAGTYVENVVVNKAIILEGAGAATTIVVATNGNSTPLTIGASNAIVRGFELTHNYTPEELSAWTFNSNGVTFSQTVTGSTLENCKVTKNRNGIYINTAQNNIVQGNTIQNNRTGINMTGIVNGTKILNNTIAENWTLGIVYYQSGAATDFGTLVITGNTFSNNWYSEILIKDVSTGTGTLNVTSNTFTDSPVTFTTSNNSSLNEPGFSAQKPTVFGGTATVPPTPLPTLRIYNAPNVTLQMTPKTLLVGPAGMTIQAAIDAASAGDTILVAAGTYDAFSVVGKTNLTITGAGDAATIIAPTALINTGVGHKYTPSMLTSVFVNGSTGITIQGMAIKSTDAVPAAGGADAIVFWNNSTGTISESIVQGIYAINGMQTGQGIAVDGGTSVLSLFNTDISGFSKNGIDVVDGNSGTTVPGNLTVNVSGGTITGAGPTTAIAQNGIMYWNRAGGTLGGAVTGANISGFDFTPDSDEATGILAYGLGTGGSLTINNNTFGVGEISVSDNTGTLDLYDILGHNHFPDYSAVIGSDIKIPPTKLNMAPATTTTTGTCGATTVDVMVNGVTDLVGYHLEVGFDKSKVTINSVTNGSFLDPDGALPEITNTTGNADGHIIWGMTQLGSGGNWNPKAGSGSLIRITFTPKVAGEVVFTIDAAKSLLVSAPDAFPIPFEKTGGATFYFGAVVENVDTNVQYCALDTAVAAAVSGQKLQLLADLTIPATVTVDKSLTLDLNGKVATYSTAENNLTDIPFALKVDGTAAILTVMDGSSPSTGKIRLLDSDADGVVDGLGIKVINGGTLNFNSGTIESPYSSVYLLEDAKMTLNGGTLTSKNGVAVRRAGASLTVEGGTINAVGGFAIAGNGTAGGTSITIKAGTITSTTTAIYHPQDGTLNISGGTISGSNGIEMKAGDLTINGGTIIGTGAYGDPTTVAGYSSSTGDAILIYSHEGADYIGDLKVNISGTAVITSTNGYALREYTTPSATTRTKLVSVTGGKFTGGTGVGAVSFTTVDPLVLKLTGGAYKTDPGTTPDYVFEPLATYLNTDGYFHIDTIISGTIAAYDLPNGTETVDGNKVDFLGEIPWYNADASISRPQGNYVGVYVTAPAAIDRNFATIHVESVNADKTWTWTEAEDLPAGSNIFSLWKSITQVPQTTTITIKWNPVSTQVFTVNVLENSVLLLPPAPKITSTDIQGYYLTGEAREFNVKVVNPNPGASYAHAIFKVSVTADANDLSLRYWNGSAFLPLPLTCNAGTCTTYYGPAEGFPIDPGYTAETKFELTAAVAGSYPFTITLEDLDTNPDTVLATLTNTSVAYTKPTVTIAGAPYYIVGEPDAFTVTINNPITGRNYANTAVFDIVITGPVPAEISALTCSMAGHTWELTTALVNDGAGKIKARIAGVDGYFTVPPTGTDLVVTCSVTYAAAGTYDTTGQMVDVITVGNERVVSTNISTTAAVYAKPVINPTNLAGPFVAGVPEAVSLSISNPGGIPAPFQVAFNYPVGTVIYFGTETRVCAAAPTGCLPFDVVLGSGTTVLDFTVTLPAAGTYDVGVSLFATVWNPDRLLASASANDVVVSGGFTVTGNFSMQGRTTRADIPVTLDWLSTLDPLYKPNDLTTNASGNNFSKLVTFGGDYTVTTEQPNYLNITSDLNKTITGLAGNRLMPTLRLLGGNAYWNVDGTVFNNIIEIGDATLVGWQFLNGPSKDQFGNTGDCNGDGIVNIQDLTLVGGNFGLTSATAYPDTIWMP